jgi:hypothetical protein
MVQSEYDKLIEAAYWRAKMIIPTIIITVLLTSFAVGTYVGLYVCPSQIIEVNVPPKSLGALAQKSQQYVKERKNNEHPR